MTHDVVIITGGAGGMGLATARIMGRDHRLMLCDVDQGRLDAAAAELTALGTSVRTAVADITDAGSVAALVAAAKEEGRVRAVVHTAGVSPQMGDPAFIVRVNALGTVNIAEALLPLVDEGFALVNVASIAGHMLPGILIPKRVFPLATTDPARFLARLVSRARPFGKQRNGVAYSFSKAFVLWYTRHMAEAFGAKGGRVVSVSPGTFDTAMGRLEEKSGSAGMLNAAALKRYGRPDEVAQLLAFLASEQAGYITGTDVLIDGGTMAGVEAHGAKSVRVAPAAEPMGSRA